MRFLTDLTLHSEGPGRNVDAESLAQIIRTVEEAGFDGLGFTDHPAPAASWMAGGGHETFDPFTGMAFAAALTSRIAVFSHLIVVPYRNPLLQASSMASVDVMAGGRSVFILGVGYMREEFRALGVDFDERNALFEEGTEVIRQMLEHGRIQHDGLHFRAEDQVRLPLPVQRPYPPLWIGGNSALTRSRVAEWADGWSIHGRRSRAHVSRTPVFSSVEEVADGVRDVHRRMDEIGRPRSAVTVQAASPDVQPESKLDPRAQIEILRGLMEVGVSWVKVDMSTRSQSVPDVIASLSEFGDRVIRPARDLVPSS